MLTQATIPARRAIVAARAAVRLIEQEAAAADCEPPGVPRSRDVETCAYAVHRLATRFIAGTAPDDAEWRIAWTTLAYLNLRTWQQRGDATCAEQSLLMEVLEAVLTDQLTYLSMNSPVEPAESAGSVAADQVDPLLSAARILTDNTPDLALHVLIGVALRAISEIGMPGVMPTGFPGTAGNEIARGSDH